MSSYARVIPTEHCNSLQDEGLAAGWNALATVVRDNNSLPAPMRELFVSICVNHTKAVS